MLDWENPLGINKSVEDNSDIASTHVSQQESTTSMQATSVNDKQVVNGIGDINQLMPCKYPWAWQYYLDANKNHWTPLDVNMSDDVADFNIKLNDQERHLYTNVFSYLTTADIIAMRNIALAVMEKMTAPELQIYQARQVFEESIHSWTYQHCIETLGFDQYEIYNRYRIVPAINNKIVMANDKLESVMRYDMNLTDPDQLKEFALAYIFFAAVFEGAFFYHGFTPIFSLQRRGLMKGTGEQLSYILRDETMHASFGIKVVNQLFLENPDLIVTQDEIDHMWNEALTVETEYANYILPEPILGYNAADHIKHFKHIANRRCKQLNFEPTFKNTSNVLPWLDEQANINKEANFFEKRNINYQSNVGLKWD